LNSSLYVVCLESPFNDPSAQFRSLNFIQSLTTLVLDSIAILSNRSPLKGAYLIFIG